MYTQEQKNLIRQNCIEIDTHGEFDSWLDNSYDKVTICDLDYEPSYALKNTDEIAYDEMYYTWLDYELTDNENLVEVDGEYYEKADVEELLTLKEEG